MNHSVFTRLLNSAKAFFTGERSVILSEAQRSRILPTLLNGAEHRKSSVPVRTPMKSDSPRSLAVSRENPKRIATIATLIAIPTLAITAYALYQAAPAIQRTVQRATRPTPPPTLAALLPQGALLTISSPDFAALLHAWTSSPQSTAWVQSANYSVFQNSRLFSRLSDAQSEFAFTARLADAGTGFLSSIAGKQSIFAWYDVGNLEFLYVTRLPATRAAQTELLQQRTHFSRRVVGTQAFYIRTEPSSTGQTRTVAFATSGDLLLLATREDLIANALQLIAHTTPPSSSLAQEPWYDEATAAQPPASPGPDLRMVLNLDRLVPMPYFHSYWVQANITEMKQYRTAVADLYREASPAGSQFREERTLLYKSPPEQGADPDLAPLAALVPPGTGVYRALATGEPLTAIASLNEKLLGHRTLPEATGTDAPEADLTPESQGSTTDLETRIDTPAPVPESASISALAQVLQSAGLNAVLTLDSADAGPTQPTRPLWIPIHSAVVLRTGHPLTRTTLTPALQQALRGTLTASNLGIDLRPTTENPAILTLSGPKPLFVALSGNLCLLANDQPLLAALLTRIPSSTQVPPTPATLLAAFNHTTQRAPYLRLTSLIDNRPTSPGAPDDPASPAFFSTNIRSLSDAFSTLQSQHVLTRHQGDTLHQTILYVWSR